MLTKVIFQKFEQHRKINHIEVHLNLSISITQCFFLDKNTKKFDNSFEKKKKWQNKNRLPPACVKSHSCFIHKTYRR